MNTSTMNTSTIISFCILIGTRRATNKCCADYFGFCGMVTSFFVTAIGTNNKIFDSWHHSLSIFSGKDRYNRCHSIGLAIHRDLSGITRSDHNFLKLFWSNLRQHRAHLVTNLGWSMKFSVRNCTLFDAGNRFGWQAFANSSGSFARDYICMCCWYFTSSQCGTGVGQSIN